MPLTPEQQEKLDSLCNGNERQILFALVEQAMLLSNATPPSGGITELTGDVTAGPGSGSQAAIVAAIQGVAISGAAAAGKVLEASSSSAASWQTPATTAPGGSSGQVQYNNAGAFAGATGMTFTAGALTGIDFTGNVTVRGINAGVVVENTGTVKPWGNTPGIFWQNFNQTANYASAQVDGFGDSSLVFSVNGNVVWKGKTDGTFQLGVAAATETVISDKTITIRDSTGTAYKLLCTAA